MTEYQMCKLEIKNGKAVFESVETPTLTLSETLENDKQYGTMKPANGKYFTYKVYNEDQEFSKIQAKKALQFAQRRWRIYTNIAPFRPARDGEIVDFKLYFWDVETDPDGQLSSNTVMYHYYPINDVTNRLRGMCVVNKKFFFTEHGNTVSGKFMKDLGFEVQYPDGQYRTLDFDAVYAHELGHGIGLPHDSEAGHTMSYRVDIMSEYPTYRDQTRGRAKYGTRLMSGRMLRRWLMWLKSASDRRRF